MNWSDTTNKQYALITKLWQIYGIVGWFVTRTQYAIAVHINPSERLHVAIRL